MYQTRKAKMNYLAHEYQKLRKNGVSPAAALRQMREWRVEVVDTVLQTAEQVGLPPQVQALVTDLDAEMRKLDGAVLKAVFG